MRDKQGLSQLWLAGLVASSSSMCDAIVQMHSAAASELCTIKGSSSLSDGRVVSVTAVGR